MGTQQNPLDWRVPIVGRDGAPTPEFQRKWALQSTINGSIPNLSDAAHVSAVLDKISAERGDLLFRGATLWEGLSPGTTGFVLTAQGVGADPVWASAASADSNFVVMTAAANLNGNFAVMADGSGHAAVPSIATLADGLAIVGITTGAIAVGATGPIQTGGTMHDSAWAWMPGPVYAADLGALTQAPPPGKWVLQVGTAETATSIAIQVRNVISTP